MTEEHEMPIGQRQNAIRAHRLLFPFFIFFGLLTAGVWMVGGTSGFKIILCFGLAASNYLVADGARKDMPWAQKASLILAVLILLSGGIFFFTHPDIGAIAEHGDVAAAFNGSFAVVLAIIQIIAAVYILLNGNWQQPTPPDEEPDADRWP